MIIEHNAVYFVSLFFFLVICGPMDTENISF